MTRHAVVDVGTNTALLLIAEVGERDELIPLVQREEIVRLGQGVDQNRRLHPEAIRRVVDTLADYQNAARSQGVESLLVTGTSAVRDSANRDELLAALEKQLSLKMRVLSGEEEAVFTYRGALSNKPELSGTITMIDIGGGSTEIISGTHDSIEFGFSVDIGSVRLTDRHFKHDPVTSTEIEELSLAVDAELDKWFSGLDVKGGSFIGIAGTVTTLAAIKLQMTEYDAELIDRTEMSLEDVQSLCALLAGKSLSQRKAITGLRPERADVILAGALILRQAMCRFGIGSVRVSDRGLRFGVLLDLLKR